MRLSGRRSLLFLVTLGVISSILLSGVSGFALATTNATQSSSSPDAVVIRADTAADGSATVSVTYRYELATENETEAFRDLQNTIEKNQTAYETAFATRLRQTIRTAENQTGRDMTLTNVSVSTTTEEFPQRYGIVTYTAEWANFANATGDSLRIGDALSGFFLDEQTRLIITWPQTYRPDTVTPTPTTETSEKIVWEGPQQFAEDEPRLLVAPHGQGTETGTMPPITTSATPVGDSPYTSLLFGAVGVGFLLVLVGGYLFVNRTNGLNPSQTTDGAQSSTTPTGATADESTDDTLRSAGEQVLALLDEEDGRMKQQQLVDEYGWSESKTSRVVNDLKEKDKINVYRIGRENVLVDPATDEFDE